MRRTALLALAASLILGACSQSPLETATPLTPAAAAAMPLPAFGSTFSGNTRGFWFQAPADFRITGLKVPDESGHGLQNVEVIKFAGAPAEYSETSAGQQLLYKTGVPSGEVIETDLTIAAGDYIGVLGAAGDATTMHNSYASTSGTFTSSILGQDVVITRLLLQQNLVISGGNQPVSSESGGTIARVEVYVEPADTTAPTVTLTTPANGATYQQGEPVTVSYSCADEEGGLGLESCTGTVADGSPLDTSIPGAYSFTVDAEDNAGNKTSVTHGYTVAAAPPPAVADSYLIDFESAPTNKLVYSVKLGGGVVHQGSDEPKNSTVPVVGKRRAGGGIAQTHLAKVVNVYGSDRLVIAADAKGNAPAPTGGRVKLSFTNFDPKGVTLTSLTLSNLVAKGAHLTFYYADGSSSRQNLGTTKAGSSLVIPLEVKGLRALDIYAPNAFAVDDVKFTDEPDVIAAR